MSNFSNSKTAENLMSAFMAENADGAKYQWLADECTKEQQSTLAKQLKMLATNEMAHAKIYQDLIIKHNSNNQVISFSLDYPITQGTILEQIKNSINAEFHQSQEVYQAFAETAQEEGFDEIAKTFLHIAQVESCHASLLDQIYDLLNKNALFKRETEIKWKCTNCGHEATSKEAWKVCPLCKKPQGYVKIMIPEQDPEDAYTPPKNITSEKVSGWNKK